MKAKCVDCDLVDDHNKLWDHCKKLKHVMIDGWPNFEFIDDVEVIEFYRHMIKQHMIKSITFENPENLIEEVECENKIFNHIHSDLTTDILDKYGKTKLIKEIVIELKSLIDRTPKESTKDG